MCIIKSTNFSQRASDPIPHHMPTINRKLSQAETQLEPQQMVVKALSTHHMTLIAFSHN